MANFYNLLHRDSANWKNCKQSLSAKGIDMADVPTDDFADKIRSIVASDGFEQTPELRQFPDIRIGLTDSTFKMIVLRNGTGAVGIAITLPSGQSGSINWGDGNTTALTASGAAVNYYHTWANWQTSTDGLEEYNIVTITGNITAIAAIASSVTAPRYWHTVLWMAAKSTTLTSFALGNSSNIFGHGLVRVDFDTPAMILGSSVFQSCAAFRTFNYSGGFSSSAGVTFSSVSIDKMVYTNTIATSFISCFVSSRIRELAMIVDTTRAVSFSTLITGNPVLRRLTINSAWGTFNGAIGSCYCLKEFDASGCPVNGITDFSANTNLYSLQKLLFPSTGSGINRIPKAFATGVTSMGHIDITNSGLSRPGLVDMFYSLPANAATRNCTITGSVGAADLTAGEIAIATAKNWVLIR